MAVFDIVAEVACESAVKAGSCLVCTNKSVQVVFLLSQKRLIESSKLLAILTIHPV